ncbi:YifB family Mg chelatase-like AAA ATPase [Corynebacterium ulceribovis]|uniref:YifB family Mg chelatase-like AAA ATPase n=1 Tax=Corynebacterium ulceribovis TaxID=487732 RepID=UPI00035D111C|nr:YifB family Mg chelatase-like AAA ATPase [Corynebacterium ulceribovis]
MAVGVAHSVALQGIAGTVVTVEADAGHGLPGISIVGLGDTAVAEAKDRIRIACLNAGLGWPKTKVVLSLSPASLPKHGSGFDLAMIAAVLDARTDVSDQMHARIAGTMFLGEVGLDGTVRAIPGVLPAVRAAREEGWRRFIVPAANLQEALLVDGIEVAGVAHLEQLGHWLTTGAGLNSADATAVHYVTPSPPAKADLADVIGQPLARQAVEIAAVGGHHLLMIGPPGSGKSMLASCLPGILPPLSPEARLELSAVHSVAGLLNPQQPVVFHPPFIAPHHSVTRSALIGGGSGVPQPGAVSLAHCGVLFLDEAAEIAAGVLDSLRTPLELGEVSLTRSRYQVTYPAQAQLVMAANPCACGAAEPSSCTCASTVRRRYNNRFSGPLLDRIDLVVPTAKPVAAITDDTAESSAIVAERVAEARQRADARWRSAPELAADVSSRTVMGIRDLRTAQISGKLLRRHFPGDEAAMAFLQAQLALGQISQRGVDRTLRVAWSLADLAARQQPTIDDVAGAIALHEYISELNNVA